MLAKLSYQELSMTVALFSAQLVVFLAMIAALGMRTLHAEVSFNFQVRPLLSRHCIRCHGPDEEDRQADLRIDTAAGAFADLGGYAAIVAGHPEQSEVIARVTSLDPDMRMPPSDSGNPLTAAEIEILREWINEGAHYEKHWSFVVPQRPDVPPSPEADWCLNEVDHFIASRCSAVSNITACRTARARPPRRVGTGRFASHKEQVTRFADDPSDKNYEQLVDELLASPAFGEHWAAMWLDLARYADTTGYAEDRSARFGPARLGN